MSEPRYGIWIPVRGNYGAMNHPLSPRDASYGRAKALIQLVQECGFTTTLIAQHLFNPRNFYTHMRHFAQEIMPRVRALFAVA